MVISLAVLVLVLLFLFLLLLEEEEETCDVPHRDVKSYTRTAGHCFPPEEEKRLDFAPNNN